MNRSFAYTRVSLLVKELLGLPQLGHCLGLMLVTLLITNVTVGPAFDHINGRTKQSFDRVG